MASGKLESRLRRAADRRRVHHGSRTPVSVAAATAVLSANGTAEAAPLLTGPAGSEAGERAEDASGPAERIASLDVDGDGPLIVREKMHRAKPMTLDQALYEMELVGHDFYLFVDADSSSPSVVYRRRGYDYGVIRLEV
jgi:hypothetical protein